MNGNRFRVGDVSDACETLNQIEVNMSNLNVEQKSIYDLFSNNKVDFLIPDYQRRYEWNIDQCSTLWDDLYSFSLPEDDFSKFDSKRNEYYLGSIVTFKNDNDQFEVIDGQQRLTTLLLLMRAFYGLFSKTKDKNSINIRDNLGKCIWKSDEFDNIIQDLLKIDSQVISDDDKQEFIYILKSGETLPQHKSRYASNYRFFQDKIQEFLQEAAAYVNYLPARIMKNCIILHIIGENIDAALRIFSTLNDRGKPLSDSDIFKAQFYKYFSSIDKKEHFIREWKQIDEECQKIFGHDSGKALDELFTRYMYYERARKRITSTTTEALRKFFEKENYGLLKSEDTWNNIISLAQFWKDVANQDSEKFNDLTLKQLFVLRYAPNGMWTYLVSVYFLHNRDKSGNLDPGEFNKFLEKITSFIWAYAFIRPGVNSLRTPVYPEMIKIIEGKPVEFMEFKFSRTELENQINNFYFSNNRLLTKSMLAWWAFHHNDQTLLDINTYFEVEHIYAKNRYDKEKGLSSRNILDMLGNKSLLEKSINIRASDYKFSDKKRYYSGFVTNAGKIKDKTNIVELIELSEKDDFQEEDILERDKMIKEQFIEWVGKNNLFQEKML